MNISLISAINCNCCGICCTVHSIYNQFAVKIRTMAKMYGDVCDWVPTTQRHFVYDPCKFIKHIFNFIFSPFRVVFSLSLISCFFFSYLWLIVKSLPKSRKSCMRKFVATKLNERRRHINFAQTSGVWHWKQLMRGKRDENWLWMEACEWSMQTYSSVATFI